MSTYVGECACVNGVFGWRGVSPSCPVLLSAHRNGLLPPHVSLELALGQSCVASKILGTLTPPQLGLYFFTRTLGILSPLSFDKSTPG